MTTLRIGMAATMLSLMACGGQELPPLPEGFEDSSLVDGKADTLTRWFTEIKGDIDFNATIGGKTSYKSWFHGYTVDLGAGDEIAVKAAGTYYGLIRVYGPQKASGSWGSVKASSWINYDAAQQAFGGAISSFKAKAAGTYLLLVGSPWDPSYSYNVSVGCSSGHCGDAFCVVYETVDSSGTALQNLYAINVATYDAGKQLLAKVSNFINEDILTGVCSTIALPCPKVYMPVCGDSPGQPKQTFGNVCSFKAYLMGLAGETSEAKGHWEVGACAPACDPKTEWWRKYVATDAKQCQLIKFYCQPNTLHFSNACGCGCEQSKECKPYYDCEPPIDCSSHQAKCPYSTFGL